MGNIINTAPCRFCGQMVQIDSEEKAQNEYILQKERENG